MLPLSHAGLDAKIQEGERPAEVAISLSDPLNIQQLPFARDTRLEDAWQQLTPAPPPLGGRLGALPLSRLYLGSEFCDRLIPQPGQLEGALAAARGLGMRVTLATPMVADAGLKTLSRLLEQLEGGEEVVVNDLGVLRLVAEHFPALEPVAGRFLCKMVKDPRLSARQWRQMYPHGVYSTQFVALLRRYGVRRLEVDVPPFAEDADFTSAALEVSVHAPFAYAAKGRMCRPGALHQSNEKKFSPAHPCRRECLDYIHPMSRHQDADLSTFQRGNTVFYRHSPGMEQAVADAIGEGRISRLIIAGDWHENHGTDQQAR